MIDYGHDLLFGAFITPTNSPPMHAVDMAIAADRAGLDLATFQDHPYQPSFHDTWTLLSYAAARTERIRLSGNVLNLPLRDPAVLARSAASLDLLSGGRFELGIGAGGFWDAIEAMGGRRLTPGQSIEALEEAIRIFRGIWATDATGRLVVDGSFYRVNGAKRGPKPAHDIGVWVGAYKPRILRMTGRAADGWLPSLAYLPGGPRDLTAMNAHIDEGATRAGRDPRSIRRLLNISGQFSATGRGLLVGPPEQWVDQLTGIALEYGISGFIVTADDEATIQLFAEVAAGVRRQVAAERG
ncbi:alkanesulfonate monooxygenase SsuD/methylene tetrahydromethanopterin reductase-like flavin-dependent oxidoreductase (luciferase family) [Okibacterium sp. HSC-33S16]|uniref:LLM class flavin-dependent oxidoreductase n=1 Tax=Okibacterium sp. HSC-33S16 TaxID=2910965 RepID=UPI0020A00078|nr:LLM class flavin-dependent oxidoreductase [Okibacterium sp. HSC-33S16]MCP2032966.1 alkanesulfonate monooxygenase SsuD/methylene tetrahydromethanopterin reductase-like flavin-dependent oxidoreductase (luciferase family) [Okibacterium sp. HSC-33S16]